MSRGHGAAQRFVLEQLSQSEPGEQLSLRSLAEAFRPGVGRSALESIRRAAKRLESDGLLETCTRLSSVPAALRGARWRRARGESEQPCEHSFRARAQGTEVEWWWCGEQDCRAHSDVRVWDLWIRHARSPEQRSADEAQARLTSLRMSADIAELFGNHQRAADLRQQVADAGGEGQTSFAFSE